MYEYYSMAQLFYEFCDYFICNNILTSSTLNMTNPIFYDFST